MKKKPGSDPKDPNIENKNEELQAEKNIETAQGGENDVSSPKPQKSKKASAGKNVFMTAEDKTDDEPANNGMGTAPEDENGEIPVPVKKVKKVKKPWSKRKKIIVTCVLGVLFLAIAAAGIYVLNLMNNPLSAFEDLEQQASNMPSQSQAPADTQASDTPTPSKGPYDDLTAQADNSILKDMINIMLIGIDHSIERDTKHWDFKDFHSDVMIVLSINKITKKVNMISLPRDTWAEIPGVKGIYKLNAAINCGGGWPTDGGFNKVMEAAEWMLGGQIPVDYYYAVDMNAVKGLVDQIGGVDYNLDLDFEIMGRSYKEGQQHMNGQAVLDYLRVRKGLPSDERGDLNRIDRQKKMLVAIFDKLRKSDILAQIPGILQAFQGNLKTNVSFAQTAALAVFMKDIDISQITMNSMDGHYDNLFNWNFVFTDQKKRVQLIKDIYGVDAKQESKYTHTAAENKWADMYAPVVIERANALLAQAKSKLDADAALPEYVAPTDGSPVPAAIPSGYKQYGSDVWALYDASSADCTALASQSGETALNTINKLINSDMKALCKKLGITIKENFWRYNWESDKSINEVTVNFN